MLAWLSSGLFLGWSLGANDAANVFGTAVTSQMVRFSTAVKLASLFIVLGGLVNGPAAMETLGSLGQIETFSGAFSVSLAAAIAIAVMTRLGLPVSTSQAVVGALIGFLLFEENGISDSSRQSLRIVLLTWVASPILAAATAFSIYKLLTGMFRWLPMPLLTMDRWLRFSHILVGCYGAWALGGNNMANVVGVFFHLNVFDPVQIGPWTISQSRSLALLGGLAISLGAVTYSYRVMEMVGRNLVRLDSVGALIAVLSEAIVVDFFAHHWNLGAFILPAIPVSTSQALVGGVLGVGIARGIHTIKMQIFAYIALGWVATPLLAGALAWIILPFLADIT